MQSVATNDLVIQTRHLAPAIAAQVEAWFRGEVKYDELSGERSVVVPHPEDPALRLKIKGAGLLGEPLAFANRHRSGPKAPHFDFEGRMMEDIASGHDNALSGGASFQQAAVEYGVSARLAGLGYDVVPCLGYGSVNRGGAVSWFSVYEWQPEWRSLTTPDFSIEAYGAKLIEYGRDVIDMAVRHRLIGYFWYVSDPTGGPHILKDLHPFQFADPINMSRISWTMHVFFALHTVALTALLSPRITRYPDRPADLQAYVFRSLLPDITREEHEALRWALVARYIRDEPKDFDPRTLHSVLNEHRLTRALMERCPDDFPAFG